MDATDSEATNALTASRKYWDKWNQTWRFRGEPDAFMQSQLDISAQLARREGYQNAKILDVGCGTGWLGNSLSAFGQVWGTDLSAAAIEEGTHRHPAVQLLCADFLTAVLPGPFDYVVSADAFATMTDHAACVRRVATLLRPGGVFLLMTQNPWIWERRSQIRQLPEGVPHAAPSQWPSLQHIRGLMQNSFVIERVSTLDPGGDRGVLFWVENRYVRGAIGRLLGRARWRSLLEVAGLGRELVIVARRRA